jgi:transcription-repair coupling factor (superfamily II helicase)
MRMVGEAVNDYKTGIIDKEEEAYDCKVELPINAHLAESYVPGERLRLDLYRRLADVAKPADVQSIREELLDRFGELPEEANALLAVAQLRALAKSHGIREVVATGKFLRLAPLTLPESRQLRLTRLYPGSIYKAPTRTALITLPKNPAWNPSKPASEIVDTSLLTWVTEVVDQLTKASTT